MNPAAGDYDRPMRWRQRLPGTQDAFGDRDPAYTEMGTVWCAVDGVTGGTFEYLGSNQATVRAFVRVRNYPAIKAGDRLADDGWGESWYVDDVRRGPNEQVCQVYR